MPFDILFSFPLGIYPEVKFLNHMVVLFLILWRTFISFPLVTVPIYIPTNRVQVFLSASLPKPIISLFDNGRCEALFIMVLNCSLMISDAEHLFMYLLSFVCLFGKMSIQFLCTSYIELFSFLPFSCMSSSYTLITLYQIYDWHIFSIRLLFHFTSFIVQKLLAWCSHTYCFLLFVLVFNVISKNYCQTWCQGVCLLYLLDVSWFEVLHSNL